MNPFATEVMKTATDRIIDYLTANFYPGYFHVIFEGDPVEIGESLLPCVVVEKVAGDITAGPTGMDRITEQIKVKVILNKKDDFGSDGMGDLTERKIRRLIESRDPVTKHYTDHSLAGILRSNFTLGDLAVGQEITVAYDVDLRPNDVITSEGHVTIIVTELVEIPIRR